MRNPPIPIRIEVGTVTTQFLPGLSTYSPGSITTYYELDEERNKLLHEIVSLWEKLGDDVYTVHFLDLVFDTLNCKEYSSINQSILNRARDWYLKNK